MYGRSSRRHETEAEAAPRWPKQPAKMWSRLRRPGQPTTWPAEAEAALHGLADTAKHQKPWIVDSTSTIFSMGTTIVIVFFQSADLSSPNSANTCQNEHEGIANTDTVNHEEVS